MLDLKALKLAAVQLEEERKVPQDKIIEAIEFSLAAAYKKEYGKRDQIVRCKFNFETGDTEFYQVKIVVDDSTVRFVEEGGEDVPEEGDERTRYNSEKHIILEDARRIKADAELDSEISFPLETKEDFGRIAAQTAKQVIIQKIREAERTSIVDEYGAKEGEIVSGYVSKLDRGAMFVDLHRATGIMPFEEQIQGEHWKRGDRIKAYLYEVDETPRGIVLRLSRTHPRFIEMLFAVEAPEIASGVVEIKAIAREPGSRSKIAVFSNDERVDPVGSCVGGRGVRVTTIMNELSGEKIDIIPWAEDPATFISNSLSPAKVLDVAIDAEGRTATIEVADDQLSLAIGKGGQNVRLAAKLTGWRIDIKGVKGEEFASSDGEEVRLEDEAGFVKLSDLKNLTKDSEESAEEEIAEDIENKEEEKEEAVENEEVKKTDEE
jgi:N utilization substance protein A